MTMKITAHQLAAFYETVKCRSFTRAAESLAVTQSALSQRIANLEADLEVTLFIRESSGPVLTSAGELLLRYCQVTDSLENEILGQLKSTTNELRGSVRIAAYSSVLRSVIMPSLAGFLRIHPKIQCEFRSYEVADLAQVLKNAEADFIIADYHLNKNGVREHILGQEEYVIIESAKYASPSDLYLDHGPDDYATESFFKSQPGTQKSYRRSFMGDVYGILNGVELGLGRAVMSKHLLKGNSRVRMIKGYKRYFRDVTLNYFEQPYYSRLQTEIIKQLNSNTTAYF